MLSIHPIIMFLNTLLALYVLCLSIPRFRFLHLKQKAVFKWKRHVILGEIVMVIWLGGLLGGAVISYVTWNSILITEAHGYVAIVMLPLILFGLFSGLYLNYKKDKRQLLPLIHGINNLAVLILALYQIYSGWWVYSNYILGN